MLTQALPEAFGVLHWNSEVDWFAERSRTHFLSQIQTDVELLNPDPEIVTNWSPAIPPEVQRQNFNAFHLSIKL